MILSNKKVSFGGKVADIKNSSFSCKISTAKEGLFKGLSSVIHLESENGLQPLVKLIYANSSSASDRRLFHDLFAEELNSLGEEGVQFSSAVTSIIESYSQRGILSEYINLS